MAQHEPGQTTGAARGAGQARAAALRAQAEREQRRRRATVAAAAAVVVVLVVIAALVAVKLSGGGTQAQRGAGPASETTQVASLVTSVPKSTLDAVGAGSASNPPNRITAPPLTQDGKPKVLYVGAEYCPYCAAQRWAVTVALSRFGTWSGLGTTHSTADDVFPNTPSLSFHGARYTSDVVAFTGYETTDVDHQPLDTVSPADQLVFDTYNTANGSIPFLDIAGTHTSVGASIDPQLLAGKSPLQVAQSLADPANPIAKAVDGSANAITAAICTSTKQQPAAVCTAPGVVAAAKTPPAS